jgi:hypothetical protein
LAALAQRQAVGGHQLHVGHERLDLLFEAAGVGGQGRDRLNFANAHATLRPLRFFSVLPLTLSQRRARRQGSVARWPAGQRW